MTHSEKLHPCRDVPIVEQRQPIRDELDRLTREYLARGEQICTVPMGATGADLKYNQSAITEQAKAASIKAHKAKRGKADSSQIWNLSGMLNELVSA